MAGWLECAAFSLYVYQDHDQPPLPDGWSVLLVCPDELCYDGYYATAFIKLTQQVAGMSFYDLVIAHRGTIFTGADLYNDLEIFFDRIPDQFLKGAYLFNLYSPRLAAGPL